MDRQFLIQGHRGACGLRPENTLPSFEAALDAGANSLETDVRLTADGVPVLMHDASAPGHETPVHRTTAAQLPGVPTLADLYRFIASRSDADHVIIDLDIKVEPFRPAHHSVTVQLGVLDVIHKAGMVHQTWVRSFDHRCVRALRAMEPTLVGVTLIQGTAPVDPVALVRAADAQVYAPDYLFLDEEQVRQCHDAGVRVLPWTVNAAADWARLIAWGVDGITTDYPDRLAAYVA